MSKSTIRLFSSKKSSLETWILENDSYQNLGNSKKYNKNPERTLSENGSVEENRAGNSSQNVVEENPEILTLTQEAFNRTIEGFIAPKTRQLEELTGLVWGMVTTPHPSHYPRTDYSAIFGTARKQPTTTLPLAIVIFNCLSQIRTLEWRTANKVKANKTFGYHRHILCPPIFVKKLFKNIRLYFLGKTFFLHNNFYFFQRSMFRGFLPKNLIIRAEDVLEKKTFDTQIRHL